MNCGWFLASSWEDAAGVAGVNRQVRSRIFTGRRTKSSCLLGTRLHRDAEYADGRFLFIFLISSECDVQPRT